MQCFSHLLLHKSLLSCDRLDEYACLWKGCEFLSMGSHAELEVHAYFHNYHGKLKFIGSQLLRSHPDLPSCNQGLHSNNLVPEGSERFACLWEHCDVRVYSFFVWFFYVITWVQAASFWASHVSFFIQSSFNNPEWFYRHVDNHVESAEQQSLAQQQQALFCQWSGMTEQTHFKTCPFLLQTCIQCLNVRVTGCDAFFKIRYRLREHMRSHTQERLVACPTCGSMFASNTKFFDHLHRQADPVGKKDLLFFFCISVLWVLLKKLIFVHLLYFNRVAGMWALRESFFQREAFKGSCSSTR